MASKKTLGYVQLEWTCPNCNSRNPGPVKTCQNCGAPQPDNVQFEQPAEQKFVTDEKAVKAAQGLQYKPQFYGFSGLQGYTYMDQAGVDRAVLLQGPFYGDMDDYVRQAVKRWPDRLAGAEVRVGDRPCLPDGQRGFRCPAMPSVVVAREVREVDGLPRPCLYTHPSPDHAHPLTITFPAVPMGRILRGHTGIVGEAALAGEAPVHLAVKIEDQDVGAFEEPPATPGWHPFQLDTSSHSGRARAVTFAITATDVTQRHFCFDAYTLP